MPTVAMRHGYRSPRAPGHPLSTGYALRRGVRAVAMLVALAIVGCGPAAAPAAGPSAPAAAAAKAIWPLRGTEASDKDAIQRRPIVVRIGNDEAARPGAGLTRADLVMEIMVEGGMTRLAAVFHSQDADRIGPVRSARLSDLHYTPMLKGILVHVGAQATVLQRVRDAARGGAFVDVDQFEHGGSFDRIPERPAPHNVFTSTKRIHEAAGKAGDRGGVSVPGLQFGSEAKGGKSAISFAVPYAGSHRVTYAFDAGTYKRTQGAQATTDEASKAELRLDNVVVIKTDFTEQPGIVEDELGSLSLEVRSTGTGPVVVLRDGQRFDGTWSREANGMYRFADASGGPIPLKPGLTWIHVVPTSFDLGG